MPNYGLTQRWEKSSEYKEPFNYIIGTGPAEDEATADAAEAEGKQVVFMRRLDMGDLIKLGIAEELDFMSKALMSDEKKQTDEKANEAVSRAIMKADNYSRMEKMVNLVVACGILLPKLASPPMRKERDGRTGEVTEIPNDAARQKGLLYVDHLPWNDRLELFSEIFDTEGLSTFRGKQEPGVGDVEHDAGVQLPADGPVALRSDDSEGVLLQ